VYKQFDSVNKKQNNNETSTNNSVIIDLKKIYSKNNSYQEYTKVTSKKIYSTETISKAPSLYTDSSLITKMEAMNIGTEATYSSIVTKILDRGYVELSSSDGTPTTISNIVLTHGSGSSGIVKTSRETVLLGGYKKRLVSTSLGRKVSSLLTQNVPDIMKYEYTSLLEDHIIQVETGDNNWKDVVRGCYQLLDPKVIAWNESEKSGVNKRVIETESYGPVCVYDGKYSPVIQWGVITGVRGKKTKYNIELPNQYKWQTVSADTVRELISIYYSTLQKHIHINVMYYEKPYSVLVKKGLKRYGPYIALYDSNSDIRSLKKTVFNVSLKKWLETSSGHTEESVLNIDRTTIQSILDWYSGGGGVIKWDTHGDYFVKVCNGKGKRKPYIQLTHQHRKKTKPIFIPVTLDENEPILTDLTQLSVTERILSYFKKKIVNDH
jgi:hypothetical protein